MKYLITMLTFSALVGCGGGNDNDRRPSGNADLRVLIVDDATLVPVFASSTTRYTASVTGGTDSTRVTATAVDDRAGIQVDGIAVRSGSPSDPIPLVVGTTTIDVQVTAEDGTRRTYTVVVTRPIPSSNANLSQLSLTVAILDQIFDPALQTYSAATGHLGSSTRVVASPEIAAASLITNGVDFEAGEQSDYVPLRTGTDSVTVLVTAEDASTTRSYVVNTTRAGLNSLNQRTYIKASNPDPEDRFGTDISLHDEILLVGAPWEQSSATGIDGNQTDNAINEAGAAYVFDRIGNTWFQSSYVKASNTGAEDRFGWSLSVANSLAIGAPGEQSLNNQQDNSGSGVGALYVFDPAAGNSWTQTAYLKASNAESDDRFATTVASEGDRILAGAPFEGSSATGVNGDESNNNLLEAGAAYLFDRDSSGNWQQVAYFKASNTDNQDQFGNAVAISNETLAIGAWLEDSGATGVGGDQNSTDEADSGAVYLFDESDSGSWSQSAYIKASNTENGDGFGSALALDDDILVVAAPTEDGGIAGNQQDNSEADAGAVYVFSRSTSGEWQQEAYIKASNPGLGDRFGSSVEILGNLLAVGAPGERSNATGINGDQQNESTLDAGAVYLFERNSSGGWSQIAYIKASNTDTGDTFGRGLGLDADTLVVGTPLEASTSSGIDGDESDNTVESAGAVYVIR